MHGGYRTAFLDWLACAAGGVGDPALLESGAVLSRDGEEVARVEAAIGSPANPMTPDRLRRKVRDLAGERLDGALEDPERPAAELLAAARLL